MLLHTITDALLGALCLPDIGEGSRSAPACCPAGTELPVLASSLGRAAAGALPRQAPPTTPLPRPAGQLFPDTDPKWKGARSDIFLKEAVGGT